MKNYTNKYFVYEGMILRAAQPTFNGAMRYFQKGFIMLQGTPKSHTTNVTKVALKINVYENN